MGYSASSAPILDSGYHFWDSDLLCRFHFHSVLQSGNLRDFLTIPILRASSFDSSLLHCQNNPMCHLSGDCRSCRYGSSCHLSTLSRNRAFRSLRWQPSDRIWNPHRQRETVNILFHNNDLLVGCGLWNCDLLLPPSGIHQQRYDCGHSLPYPFIRRSFSMCLCSFSSYLSWD